MVSWIGDRRRVDLFQPHQVFELRPMRRAKPTASPEEECAAFRRVGNEVPGRCIWANRGLRGTRRLVTEAITKARAGFVETPDRHGEDGRSPVR